jgi:hypothetical protein
VSTRTRSGQRCGRERAGSLRTAAHDPRARA